MYLIAVYIYFLKKRKERNGVDDTNQPRDTNSSLCCTQRIKCWFYLNNVQVLFSKFLYKNKLTIKPNKSSVSY